MKFLVPFLLLTSICVGQEINRDQLKQEVVQIKALSQKQKNTLSSAQFNLKEVQRKADVNLKWGIDQSLRADNAELRERQQKERADAEHRKAVQNGRERDVFVVLFAIAATIATVSLLMPIIGKLQFPWNIVAPIAACIIFFAAYYGIIRLALHFITNLI